MGKDTAELYTGSLATEAILWQKAGAHWIHLATHGFFFGDSLRVLKESTSAERGLLSVSLEKAPPTSMVKPLGNPLLQSGFVLAGANRFLENNETLKIPGIVTAEKILELPLRGTEMVVLSACNTGLGEVRNGEGVLGLRRALSQAGAKSLVMSMWPVPDLETRELMIAFYKKMLKDPAHRCQALRQAVLEELRLATRRYGPENPLYWGAFVFMGDPW